MLGRCAGAGLKSRESTSPDAEMARGSADWDAWRGASGRPVEGEGAEQPKL